MPMSDQIIPQDARIKYVMTSLRASKSARANSPTSPSHQSTGIAAETLELVIVVRYQPNCSKMDFRELDQMGETDEAILAEPYRPFYNPFRVKPVLVKQ